MKKLRIILVVFTCLGLYNPILANSNRNDSITNLKAFAKLYGYIRYFHPSNESAVVNWDNFLVAGVQEIVNSSPSSSFLLKKKLEQIFKPVAPSFLIFNKYEKKPVFNNSVTNKKHDEVVYWQHSGYGFGTAKAYQSVRINKTTRYKLFNAEPAEYIIEELTDSLMCYVPLRVPLLHHKANVNIVDSLSRMVDKGFDNSSLSVRLANVIFVWNVIQHFYPYFSDIKTDWQPALKKGLENAWHAHNAKELMQTLGVMTAPLNDGHLRIYAPSEIYLPPFTYEMLNKQVVITNVFQDSCGLKRGDIVSKINNTSIEDTLQQIETTVSSSTPWHKRMRALDVLIAGIKNEQKNWTVIRDKKEISIHVKNVIDITTYYDFAEKSWIKFRKISDSLYYLNLSKTNMSDFLLYLSQLQDAKGIIFDLRGYPGNNIHDMLSYLMCEEDTAEWMMIPQIIYPNREALTFSRQGWNIQPKAPYLKAKRIFITDVNAISYSESILGLVKGYKLGTIIGQPTAGANGNINRLDLLGGIKMIWTGMRVLRLDGSPLLGKGITPDVLLERTIEGVKNGKDEFLEKAVELAK